MSTDWQQYFNHESPPPVERYAVISHTTRGHGRSTREPKSKDEFLGFIKIKHYPKLCDIAERVQAVDKLQFRDFTNNVVRKALKRDMLEWPWKMEPPALKKSILDGKTIRTEAQGERWKSRLEREVDNFFPKEEHRNVNFDTINSRYHFWRRHASHVADTLRQKRPGLSAMQAFSNVPHGHDYYDDRSYLSGSKVPKSGSKRVRSPHPAQTFLSGHSSQSHATDNSSFMTDNSFRPASSDKGSTASRSTRSSVSSHFRPRSIVSSHNSFIPANSDKGSRNSAPSTASSSSSRRSAIFSESSGGDDGLSSKASSVSGGNGSTRSQNSSFVLPSDSASIQGYEPAIKSIERDIAAAQSNAGLSANKQSAHLFEKYMARTRGGSPQLRAHKRPRGHSSSTGEHHSRHGHGHHHRREAAPQSEASGVTLVSHVTSTNNPLRVKQKIPRNMLKKSSFNWAPYIINPA
ncbi:hypothetical protein ACMFMF_006377 [Clarireedia jacksonii]